MKRDLTKRILNSLELIAYFVAYFLFLFYWSVDDEELLMMSIAYILLLRMCLNYIIQEKILDLAIISIFRKIFKK